MNKKAMSAVMAATMTVSAVMPVFANQTDMRATTVVPVDVRTANGEAMSIVGGKVVKTEIEGDNVVLAKNFMDTKIKELDAKSTETFESIVDGKVVVKNKYTVAIDEDRTKYAYSIDAEGNFVDNIVVVAVTNTIDDSVVTYEFIGIGGFDTDTGFGQDITVVNTTLDLSVAANSEKMTKIQYQLEKNKGLLTVDKKKTTHSDSMGYDLTLTVKLKDGTKLANIVLTNVNALNTETYITLPTTGDIVSHWAKDNVLEAMASNWVDASTAFRPDASITRAEFVKVVNRAFNIQNSDMSLVDIFDDVKSTQWFYADVKAAVKAGYLDGYGDGTFRPEQPISREEAAKIVAKLHANKDLTEGADVVEVEIVQKDVNGVLVHKDTKTTFKDDAKIGIWADESVAYLTSNKIVDGYGEDNTFRPQNKITRAEAVVMMDRAINQ